MNIYDVDSGDGYYQCHSVVAKNIGDAEKTYKLKYPNCTIKEISLHSVYVQISPDIIKSEGI